MIKEKFCVVHDKDLEKLLDGLGLLKKIEKGELKCKFCKQNITISNLYSIFPQSGDIKIVCNNMDCIKELNNLLREGVVSL